MKHLFIALFFIYFLFPASGQNNVVKTAGVSYTAGAPTFSPGRTGSQVAIDTVTGYWYEYNGTSWSASGYRVQTISGCSAPAYTPAKYQSRLVINACTAGQGGPELYYYTGSTWLQINEGQTYTAGTGIAISGGNVISSTVVAGKDSTFALLNGGYDGKDIGDNIYKNGTLGLKTTDTIGVLNITISDSVKTAISIRSTNNTSGQNFIKLKPIGITGLSNIGSFNIVGQKYSGVNLPYSSRPNYAWNIGYNVGTNSGREVSTESAFGLGFETYFQNSSLSSGSTGFSEFHARYTDTTGFEHRFLSGILPWDGKAGKAQFGVSTDQFNLSDYRNNPVWIINPFTNTWDFYDTTDMKFGERRGFGLKVLNGAGSFYMDLLTFNNSDNLRIGNFGQMPEVQIESDLVLQRSRLYAASGDASVQIGSSSRKQNLIINGFNDEALRMVGGSSGRTWSFEAGNQFALRDITANTYPQFFYSGLSNFVFIMRDNNVGFGGVPSNFPLARLHVYSPSGASANLIAIDNTTGTNYFRRSNAAPATGAAGDITLTSISGVGDLWVHDGTSNRALAKVIKATATIDFPSTSAQQSSDLTITVTGAVVGDVVNVAIPGSPNANSCFTSWVSAANTVTVRFNNYSASPIDPASGTYNAIVTKY